MADRKINLAIVHYLAEDGKSYYGFNGDVVKVNDSDVDRFDALNEQHGTSGRVVPDDEDHPEPFLDIHSSGAGPDPLDSGEENLLKEPAKNAPVAAWRAYAEQEGVEDFATLTKAELIAEFED